MHFALHGERRRDVRIPVSLQVLTLTEDAPAVRRRATSLSATTVTVAGEPLEAGAIVQLELQVPGHPEAVWAAGEVIAAKEPHGNVIGLRQMAETDRLALRSFLARRTVARPRGRIVAGGIEIARPGELATA